MISLADFKGIKTNNQLNKVILFTFIFFEELIYSRRIIEL